MRSAANSNMLAQSVFPVHNAVGQSRIPVPEDQKPGRKAPAGLKVFLVEDSALFRERLTENLESTGTIDIVGSADTEQSAIAALQLCTWDVVVLDLLLRQGSGLEVLKALQQTGRPARTTVIVLTDHDFYLYRSKALEFGADHFYVKSREANLVIKLLKEMASRRVFPTPASPF